MFNKDEKKFCLIITLFVFFLYGRSLTFSFVTDDWMNIFDNSKLYALSNIKDIFTKPQLNFGKAIYYRPFDTLYFLFTYKLFGDSAFFYHFLNILLFACFSLLLFKFLVRFTKEKNTAFLVTLLFVSHPLMVEPVCWISARNQIIEGVLFLTSLIFFEKLLQRYKTTDFLIFLLSSLAAMLFHDTGVMLLPIIMSYSLIFHQHKVLISKNMILFFITVIFFLIIFLIRESIVPIPRSSYSLSAHILTALNIFRVYLKNIILPLDLKVHYYDVLIKNSVDSEVIVSALIVVITLFLVIFLSAKKRIVLFGSLFFVFSYFPASGLISFIQKSLISDRYAFLPMIGVAIMLSQLFDMVKNKRNLYVLIVIITTTFCILNIKRQGIWKNDLENGIQRVYEFPYKPEERANLAAEYVRLNRLDDAERELITGFNLAKEPVEQLYNNYAMVATIKGDYVLAEKLYLKYLEYNKKSHSTLYNLGTLYLELGNLNKAKYYLEEAYRYAPVSTYIYADIVTNLGIVMYNQGNKEEALKFLEMAVKARPNDEKYLKNLEFIKKNR